MLKCRCSPCTKKPHRHWELGRLCCSYLFIFFLSHLLSQILLPLSALAFRHSTTSAVDTWKKGNSWRCLVLISCDLYRMCWAQSKIKVERSKDRGWLGCSCVSTDEEGTTKRAHKHLAKDRATSFGFCLHYRKVSLQKAPWGSFPVAHKIQKQRERWVHATEKLDSYGVSYWSMQSWYLGWIMDYGKTLSQLYLLRKSPIGEVCLAVMSYWCRRRTGRGANVIVGTAVPKGVTSCILQDGFLPF